MPTPSNYTVWTSPPPGSGSGWTDSGVDTEAGKVQINSTPIADPTPTREGFDAAPQEYARGVNEGFGVADNIPDMSILDLDTTESGRQFGSYRELKKEGAKDAHHVIQNAAVREVIGYNKNDAPTIQLDGPSYMIGSEHYLATQEQMLPGGGTYALERIRGYRALREAGVPINESKQQIKIADEYFGKLGVQKDTPLRIPANRKGEK